MALKLGKSTTRKLTEQEKAAVATGKPLSVDKSGQTIVKATKDQPLTLGGSTTRKLTESEKQAVASGGQLGVDEQGQTIAKTLPQIKTLSAEERAGLNAVEAATLRAETYQQFGGFLNTTPEQREVIERYLAGEDVDLISAMEFTKTESPPPITLNQPTKEEGRSFSEQREDFVKSFPEPIQPVMDVLSDPTTTTTLLAVELALLTGGAGATAAGGATRTAAKKVIPETTKTVQKMANKAGISAETMNKMIIKNPNKILSTIKAPFKFAKKHPLSTGTIVGATTAVLTGQGIAAWAATDNIATGAAMTIRGVADGVEQGYIPKDRALEAAQESMNTVNDAQRFVRTISKYNPFLWFGVGENLVIATETAKKQILVQTERIINAEPAEEKWARITEERIQQEREAEEEKRQRELERRKEDEDYFRNLEEDKAQRARERRKEETEYFESIREETESREKKKRADEDRYYALIRERKNRELTEEEEKFIKMMQGKI